jgi:formylglycine-generating enzyme required for sulfatase activity
LVHFVALHRIRFFGCSCHAVAASGIPHPRPSLHPLPPMNPPLFAISLLSLAALTGALSAQGWSQLTTLTAPAARNSHAMTYDLTRSVAVMFGGYDGTSVARGDTWEWNGFGWVRRVTAVAPAARWGHGMVFDSRRNQVLMFGGYEPNSGCVSDTWTWNGSTWQQIGTPSAPAGRAYFGIAYDSIRGRTVVHGGLGNSLALLGDTWEFDGQNWAQSAANGPGGRRGPAMTFDDTRGNVVLFGGGDGAQTFGDTWTYDGSAWTQRTTASAPSPRWQAQMEHDTLCGRAVLHGGADSAYATNYGDSWAWDGAAWTQLSGTSPAGRHGAASAFDAQKGQTVLWGGRAATGFFADTWQLSSPCSRTMSVVTPPQVGRTASFRFAYPGSAAGHFYFHLLTANQQIPYAVPIPGISSIGLSRVDLFNIYLQPSGLLDASGSNVLNVGIPPDNFLAGLAVDVQTVDFNFFTNTLYWASNDAEVSIESVIPPVVSFTATPRVGVAPLTVQFTDTSAGDPTSWQWDFNNDGLVDSTLQHPSWTYTNDGVYSVRLVASRYWASAATVVASCIGVGTPNPLLGMVAISPGTFNMGDVTTNGTPVHSVTISRPFWIASKEVNQSQYLAVMGYNPSYHQGASYVNSGQMPVERVSWNDATAFCASLNAAELAAGRVPNGYCYRLPTEAEWEYCCRAGTTTYWSFGDVGLFPSWVNFNGYLGRTAVCGSYPANQWQLFDMHGNVYEWVLDAYADYLPQAVVDPCVLSGALRMYRGGGWPYGVDAYECRSAKRNYGLDHAWFGTGFRICLGPILAP